MIDENPPNAVGRNVESLARHIDCGEVDKVTNRLVAKLNKEASEWKSEAEAKEERISALESELRNVQMQLEAASKRCTAAEDETFELKCEMDRMEEAHKVDMAEASEEVASWLHVCEDHLHKIGELEYTQAGLKDDLSDVRADLSAANERLLEYQLNTDDSKDQLHRELVAAIEERDAMLDMIERERASVGYHFDRAVVETFEQCGQVVMKQYCDPAPDQFAKARTIVDDSDRWVQLLQVEVEPVDKSVGGWLVMSVDFDRMNGLVRVAHDREIKLYLPHLTMRDVISRAMPQSGEVYSPKCHSESRAYLINRLLDHTVSEWVSDRMLASFRLYIRPEY